MKMEFLHGFLVGVFLASVALTLGAQPIAVQIAGVIASFYLTIRYIVEMIYALKEYLAKPDADNPTKLGS